MYCNYGTLAHEKAPVYAYVAADCANLVSVEIPEKYHPAELLMGGYSVELPLMGESVEVNLKDALNKFVFFRESCKIKNL